MADWTKITKDTDSGTASDGWGADTWGSSAWGGATGTIWTKVTKDTSNLFTKIVKET